MAKDTVGKLYKIRDKITDKHFLSIVLIVAFVITSVGFYLGDYVYRYRQMLLPESNSLTFSADSGFYTESVELTVGKGSEVPFGAKIYYSLDGSDPRNVRYSEPLRLNYYPGQIKVYCVKAAVCYFGRFSNTVTRTYVVGDKPFDIDFINITADSDALYDYDTGIFEAGKTYDENVKNGVEGYIPGNYSMRGEDWTRDARFVMIDSDGRLVCDRDVGIAVAGGTSSAYAVKSLRIIGNNSYTDKGNIKLDLSLDSVSDYSLSDEHNSIRLRSGSQDRNIGNVRSAVVSRLADEAGFAGCPGTRRALVFLNGELYGVFDIQQDYTESFLRDRFSLPDAQNITRWESYEGGVFRKADIKKYFDADLTVKENREELERHIDLDDYFRYYAVECLIDNTDWPDNNVKMWAYTGGYDGVNPYTDGRYRFLVFDTDLSYYIEGNNAWFDGCFRDNLVSIMEGLDRGKSSYLPKLMEIPEYKEKFLTILSDMLAGAFKRENVLRVIDEEIAKVDGIYNSLYSQQYNEVRLNGLELLKKSASQRDAQIRDDVEKYFDSHGSYRVNINNCEGITLSWINKEVYPEESYNCDYFEKSAFTVKAVASPGYEFRYFTVNGEVYDSDEFTVSEAAAVDGTVNISVTGKKIDGALMSIDEISAKGNDYIVLKNTGTREIKLDNYYISDSEKNLLEYRLPAITLAASESVTVYCKNNHHALNDYICNFNLSGGEVLYLYDSGSQTLLESVFVPQMGANETYKRYEGSSVFKFFKNGDAKQ